MAVEVRKAVFFGEGGGHGYWWDVVVTSGVLLVSPLLVWVGVCD